MHLIPLSWVIHLVEGQQVRRRWNWYIFPSPTARNSSSDLITTNNWPFHHHHEIVHHLPNSGWAMTTFLMFLFYFWCLYYHIVPLKGCQTLGIFKTLSWVRAIPGTVCLTIKVRLFRATGQHWPLEGGDEATNCQNKVNKWEWGRPTFKHRKNCECCPVSLLIVR